MGNYTETISSTSTKQPLWHEAQEGHYSLEVAPGAFGAKNKLK